MSTIARQNEDRWWIVLLLGLGGLLVPVAIVASWFNFLILNEDRFVGAVSPVIRDEQVREHLAASLQSKLNTSVDQVIRERTDLGPVVQLIGTSQVVEEQVSRVVTAAVSSDAFADIWVVMNRTVSGDIHRTIRGESRLDLENPRILRLVLTHLQESLGVSPDEPLGQLLAAIPEPTQPRLEVLHTPGTPLNDFLVDNAAAVALVTSILAAALLTGGLWLIGDRRLGLIVAGISILTALVVYLWTRFSLVDRLAGIEDPRDYELALAYARALTASLETSLLLAAAIGGIVAFIAWLWPRLGEANPGAPIDAEPF